MGSAVTLMHDSIIIDIGEKVKPKHKPEQAQEQQKEQIINTNNNIVQHDWQKLYQSSNNLLGNQQQFINSSYGNIHYYSSQSNLTQILANMNQITDDSQTMIQ